MCLYQLKLRNPHYLPNEKNGGKAPICEDKRKLHILTSCGWCEECRKEIARNWKIRINEELKENKRVEMVTLTFSPQSIAKLEEEIFTKKYKGLERGDLEANILAAYAVRMFTERWRKKYGKVARHFFVTELGHENSERIHMHGFIWQTHEQVTRSEFVRDIQEKWSYGNVDFGQWVDERSINYISKYITKLDKFNDGYKQRIFTSKGLGKQYIEKNKWKHEFREEETCTTYLTSKGYRLPLPKYFKEKLFSEEERERLWEITLDKDEIWLKGTKWRKSEQDDMDYRNKYYNALRTARAWSSGIGYGDNSSQVYKYLITDKMKMSKQQLIECRHKREVKRVEKRQILKTEEHEDIDFQELGKHLEVDRVIFGEYIGNLTDGERKRNLEMREAAEAGVSVRMWRLMKKGVV